MNSQEEKLNFLFVPLMSSGHIIPMVDMAKVVASHGVSATIITTTMNATRFKAAINRAAASSLPIRILQFQFPSEEAGLPKGCESADSLPSYSLIRNFYRAIEMLQQPIENIIEDLNPSPSCIICDKHFPWIAPTARKYRIPWISFDGMSCFTKVCTHVLRATKVHESVPEGQPFVVPDLPDEIGLTKFQLPGIFNQGTTTSKQLNDVRQRIWESETEAFGLVINSFEELEGRYVDELRKQHGGRVWCVGPLSLCNQDSLDKAQRGLSESPGGPIDSGLIEWLDSRKPGTVVYACLGSLNRLTVSQFIELALALEASNHPFMLVVRGEKAEEIDRWVSEDGYEERVKGRGLLIRDWAPQVLILSHPAIGGFLTHCGWNSTVEGVCAGVPMITWPMFGDQFFNEKLVVQVLKTGLGVGAKIARHLGEEEKPEMRVSRDEIQRAVRMVMEEDDRDANERRKRAEEVAEMAKKAVEEGGSSYLNLSLLIQDIWRRANASGETKASDNF